MAKADVTLNLKNVEPVIRLAEAAGHIVHQIQTSGQVTIRDTEYLRLLGALDVFLSVETDDEGWQGQEGES